MFEAVTLVMVLIMTKERMLWIRNTAMKVMRNDVKLLNNKYSTSL